MCLSSAPLALLKPLQAQGQPGVGKGEEIDLVRVRVSGVRVRVGLE